MKASKTRNYDIFVANVYDYALIDSFGGFPGLIDSPTSYATLLLSKTKVLLLCRHGDKRRLMGERQRQAESTEACRQR